MSSGDLSPGDIVLIAHRPLDDPLAQKARPALVVSGSAFNRSGLDVIVVALSSVIRQGDTKQIVIQDADPSFPKTGLKVTSAVKCGALFAYPKSQIHRKLGVAPELITREVRALLVKFLTDA
jgi:mRNA-degrading endonuclease toxin of MazEF toxin-antitoxin module